MAAQVTVWFSVLRSIHFTLMTGTLGNERCQLLKIIDASLHPSQAKKNRVRKRKTLLQHITLIMYHLTPK